MECCHDQKRLIVIIPRDVRRSDSSTVSVINRSTPNSRRQRKPRTARAASDESYSRLPVKRITSLRDQNTHKTTRPIRKSKEKGQFAANHFG